MKTNVVAIKNIESLSIDAMTFERKYLTLVLQTRPTKEPT